MWNGCNLSLFSDMTKEPAERRKTITTAKQLLCAKNVKFKSAFPTTLNFTWRRRNRKFEVASEAVKFIEQHIEM